MLLAECDENPVLTKKMYGLAIPLVTKIGATLSGCIRIMLKMGSKFKKYKTTSLIDANTTLKNKNTFKNGKIIARKTISTIITIKIT